MHLKKTFGALLTVLGIAGIIYTSIQFAANQGSNDIEILNTFGILGFIFFMAGLGLIRSAKNEAL